MHRPSDKLNLEEAGHQPPPPPLPLSGLPLKAPPHPPPFWHVTVSPASHFGLPPAALLPVCTRQTLPPNRCFKSPVTAFATALETPFGPISPQVHPPPPCPPQFGSGVGKGATSLLPQSDVILGLQWPVSCFSVRGHQKPQGLAPRASSTFARLTSTGEHCVKGEGNSVTTVVRRQGRIKGLQKQQPHQIATPESPNGNWLLEAPTEGGESAKGPPRAPPPPPKLNFSGALPHRLGVDASCLAHPRG